MDAARLSVVVPAYNNAATLAETLESILAETELGIEVVVADHASTDATRSVMDRFGGDARVRLLDTPGGGGAERNWRRVTEAARGEYLKLVCGDDVVKPGALRRQVALLDAHPRAVLTASRRDVVDARGTVLVAGWGLRGISSGVRAGRDAIRAAVRAGSNLFGEPASVMMRREALETSGGWFGRFPYLIDQATYSRVLVHGDFVPDAAVGATFRMSAAQWSVALTSSQAAQAREFHRWFAREHPDILSRDDVFVGNVRATLMAHARRASYRVLRRRMR